jgi:methyltransferase (TIGR00027 family)
MTERPIEKRSSRTAAYTCVTRAALNRERDPLLHCPDDMSQVFLPLAAWLLVGITPLRRFFLTRLAPPGIPEYVLARTRVLDDAFTSALDEGFPQVVLLGAGFDTRALRFGDRNPGTKVFELDIASTQEAKLGVYRSKQVVLPDSLFFVPIDFDRQDIGETLRAAGYRDGEKTLFLWEGVTMYLMGDAVHGTLDFAGSSAAKGSVLMFDYVIASVLRGESDLLGDVNALKTVAKAGEAWTFGIEEGKVGQLLSDHGFELRSHYTAADMERMYFTNDDGTVLRRVNGSHCIVTAAVRQGK